MRPIELEDIYRLQLPSDPQLSPDGTRLAVVVTTADEESDENRSAIWLVAVDGDGDAAPTVLTQGPHDAAPRWSPDGSQLAFVAAGRTSGSSDAELRVLPLGDGESRVVATGVGLGNVAWSPDGEHIAYLALADPVDAKPRHAPVVTRRLGFKADGVGLLGDRRRHVFTIALGGGAPTQVTEGDFSVAAGPAWSPDGARIAWAAPTDADPDLEYVVSAFVSSASGGAPKRVTEAPAVVSALTWLPDGESLVVAGHQRATISGHTHLFTVPADGGALRPVGPRFDRNVMVGGPGYPGAPPRLLADGRLLFCARDRGCTHAYVVDLEGGEPVKLLGDDGLSIGGLAVDDTNDRIVVVASSPTSPGDVFIGGERRTTFFDAELELLVPVERTFTAPDGTPIHGWVLRGDEAAAPGPMLLDIHGGPHNAWNGAFDGIHLYHQHLAQRGWTILYVNPRGSDGYGEDFFCAVTEAWGTSDADDFMCAVDALIGEGVADPARVAVTGYSYGGYMTCWLTARTDRFAAAIAGGCLSNLTSATGTSDLGYFLAVFEFGGLPPDEPRLVELSPLTYVDNVHAPTLILHGENDDRCDVGQAEEWFGALRQRRIETEFVRYPGASHLFILAGRPSHRIDYNRRVADWAVAHTKGD
jgi:dipeptidyl aminopeptidase/acylaminoacyl peptidase